MPQVKGLIKVAGSATNLADMAEKVYQRPFAVSAFFSGSQIPGRPGNLNSHQDNLMILFL
jgi:hypothetical protein